MRRFFPEADRLRSTTWPEPTDKDGTFLFSPRPRFRHLVVMVDNELLVEGPPQPPLTRASVLSELLRSPLVRLYRYADTGPVGVTPNPRIVDWMSDTYEGWVVAEPSGEWDWLVSYNTLPGHWAQSGVTGNAVPIAAGDEEVDVYRDLDPGQARARRLADGLASQVALQGLAADLYVTERRYLHAVRWDLARGVTICTPGEALPLVGLYLRAQGDFRFAERATMNRGLYYWVGTREVVSSAWRMTAALGQFGKATGDNSLLLLGISLLQRFERALEARDALHVAMNQPQHNDTRREALTQLDDLLVNLMGTMDVGARVAHRVLGLQPSKEFSAGWQKKDWRKEVRTAAAPALVDLVDPGTEGHDVLTVLRLLRNSVHGTALQAIALQERMRPQQSLVAIPKDTERELLDAMLSLGGEWGVRQLVSGQSHVDPGVFVERLVPYVAALLNKLLDEIPFERLDNVTLSDDDRQPPGEDPRNTGVWDEWVRLSLRWQLGF